MKKNFVSMRLKIKGCDLSLQMSSSSGRVESLREAVNNIFDAIEEFGHEDFEIFDIVFYKVDQNNDFEILDGSREIINCEESG